jgi:hypothetical protein
VSILVTNQTAARQTAPIRAIMAAGLGGALGSAGFIAGLFLLHDRSNA